MRWPAVGGDWALGNNRAGQLRSVPLPQPACSSPVCSWSVPRDLPPHPVLQVVKAHRSADKKPMRQIQPVSSSPSLRPMLLSLNDEGVHLHALPTLLLKFQVRMA